MQTSPSFSNHRHAQNLFFLLIKKLSAKHCLYDLGLRIAGFIIWVLIKTWHICAALADFLVINILVPTLCMWSFSCVTHDHMTNCTWKYLSHFIYILWCCFHFIFINKLDLIQSTSYQSSLKTSLKVWFVYPERRFFAIEHCVAHSISFLVLYFVCHVHSGELPL